MVRLAMPSSPFLVVEGRGAAKQALIENVTANGTAEGKQYRSGPWRCIPDTVSKIIDWRRYVIITAAQTNENNPLKDAFDAVSTRSNKFGVGGLGALTDRYAARRTRARHYQNVFSNYSSLYQAIPS